MTALAPTGTPAPANDAGPSSLAAQEEARVRAFLRTFSDPAREKGRCLVFGVWHSVAGGREPVSQRTLPATGSEGEREAAIELEAGEILSRARTIAAQYPTPQMFMVTAHPNEKAKPVDSLPIRLSRPPAEGGALLLSETGEPGAATRDAIVLQSFERSQRDNFASMHRTQDRLLSMLDRAEARGDMLMDKVVAMIAQVQEALDRQAARQVETHVALLAANRTERHWIQGEKALSDLAATVGGAIKLKYGIAGADAGSMLLRSLTRAQIGAVLVALDPASGGQPGQREAFVAALDAAGMIDHAALSQQRPAAQMGPGGAAPQWAAAPSGVRVVFGGSSPSAPSSPPAPPPAAPR
jgi:hypothetical protein